MSDTPTVRVETHTITTRDQTLIHAFVYRPSTPVDRVAIIGAAMGVRQNFYKTYATYLAEQGFVAVTFDYRGIGLSRGEGALRDHDATLLDWGAQDLQAVIAWVRSQHPAHEIVVVGHSISGQLLGLAPDVDHVQAFLGISAQNSHWNLWGAGMKLPLLGLWYGALPALTALMGYFPAGLLGLGEPQPSGIARDWARTARQRYGLLDVYGGEDDNHYAEFRGAMMLYSFRDDRFAPKRTVTDLPALYPNARAITHQHIDPQDKGVSAIGHMGFFKPDVRDTLWRASTQWLLDPLPDAEPA
jgi:predicted alpha/beta hydrolase